MIGATLSEIVLRLSHRPGPVDATLSAVASGRLGGVTDIENNSAVVILRGIPLLRTGQRIGALLFTRDVTDLRRRERALARFAGFSAGYSNSSRRP